MSNEVKEVYQGSGLCPKLGYAPSGSYKGWVFAQHPAGQWVTLFQVPQPANPHAKEENSNSAEKTQPCGETNNDHSEFFNIKPDTVKPGKVVKSIYKKIYTCRLCGKELEVVDCTIATGPDKHVRTHYLRYKDKIE